MTGKPKPLEAFNDNMADAHQLVKLAEGFSNIRVRRMRKELRDRVGDALDVAARDRSKLDRLQSEDVFLTFLPGSRLGRDDFGDLRPLLRQAIVAGCAATETYLADKVMENLAPLLARPGNANKYIRGIRMTLGDWLEVESRDERREASVRELVVERYVREQASTASNKVGLMLNLLDVDDWSKKIDKYRKVDKGETIALLDRVSERRNRIAHRGDRVGSGRATLDIAEVKTELTGLESVVDAVEFMTRALDGTTQTQ